MAKSNKGVERDRFFTKSEQWDELGDSIITFHARRFNKELNELEGRDFIDAYTKVLEYFKPKLARKEIKQELTNEDRVLTIEYIESPLIEDTNYEELPEHKEDAKPIKSKDLDRNKTK